MRKKAARRAAKPLRKQIAHFRARVHIQAIKWAAKLNRLKARRTTFIGVTGSAGKTTTVTLGAAVLSVEGNCDSGFGLNPDKMAQSLYALGASTEFGIYEVHATHPGAISEYVALLRPQIGVVTAIGGDHYKNYRSLEATAREKGLLIESLPKTGVAILNADDPHVSGMASRAKGRVLTYGRSKSAELKATNIHGAWPERLRFTVTHGKDSAEVETRLVGEHWVTSALAAIAIGRACGIALERCAKALSAVEPVFGRYSVHAGPAGSVFVLDTNKASFWTLPAGIDFVKAARAQRKTVVFGTLADYPGSGSPRYRRIAREALEVADRVMFVGPNAGHVEKLRQGDLRDRLLTFQTCYQASQFLTGDRVPGEFIYLKASSNDHLERLMLAQCDRVVCWLERCESWTVCPKCKNYRVPNDPPFGLNVPGSDSPDRVGVSVPKHYGAAGELDESA